VKRLDFAAFILITLAASALQSNAQINQPARNVMVNRVRLSDREVAALEQMYRSRIQDGSYWYDRRSGAWGIEGGPTIGFVYAGVNAGGQMRPDASNGRSGVFINGRELHVMDVMALSQLGPVRQGRYWLDALGNCGYEGGPAFVNVVQLAQSRGSRGPWSVSSGVTGGSVGGDGNGFLFYQDKNTSWTN
jgi:hypothetical protein